MPEIDANSFFESNGDSSLYHTWREWKGDTEKFWEIIKEAGSIKSITLSLKNGSEYTTDILTPHSDDNNWFTISGYKGDIYVSSVANMRIYLNTPGDENVANSSMKEDADVECVLTISLQEFSQNGSFDTEAFWNMMNSFTLTEGCFYQLVPRYIKEQIFTREIERSSLKGHCKIAGKNYELMQISKILVCKGYVGEVSKEMLNDMDKAVQTLSMDSRSY